MRIYFYLLAGITSALVGWNIGQFFIYDLGLLKRFPEIVLFPCIAISVAIGIILNEIFISNPTRPKLCCKKAIIPSLIALTLGGILGLLSGVISTILFLPQFNISAYLIRIIGWLIIGIAIGLTEGLTWRWQTIEAGDYKSFWQRFYVSITAGGVASLVAAFLFEFLRAQLREISEILKNYEDPIGFAILGLLLGLTFSLTNSPSYLVALRAGAGFEYTGEDFFAEDLPKTIESNFSYPLIKTNILTFVSDSKQDKIEEGLSIKLPIKGIITVGSNSNCDILLPDIPVHVADFKIERRKTYLIPDQRFYRFISYNGNRLSSSRKISLRHNNLITFFPIEKAVNPHRVYRFVYYNRFFDPQG